MNLLGSFLLGLLMRVLPAWGVPAELRALLTVGFCGSFTTFSTFGYETVALVEAGMSPLAAAYVVTSVGLGLVGVACGLLLGSALA